MNTVWISDIHLDHLDDYLVVDGNAKRIPDEGAIQEFCRKILDLSPDQVVLTGDISISPGICSHLSLMEKHLQGVHLYFVLGNHDYYNGSISGTRASVRDFCHQSSKSTWLSNQGVIALSSECALLGHDTWYDGGYSDWFKSKLLMSDYYLIEEMKYQMPTLLYQKINELSREGAEHIEKYGREACEKGYKKVIMAMHVPPFRENSRAPDGSLSNADWLPNMSSARAGNAILSVADDYKDVEFLVLSGHTHTFYSQVYGEHKNIKCLTAKSHYGKPELSIQLLIT